MYNGYPYGVVVKTTNGGANWGYQIPDTSIRIDNYFYVGFINKNNGWAYQNTTGIHTKCGGNDTTYYTTINNLTTMFPSSCALKQNYPNPFNAITKIKYIITKVSDVKIIVSDVQGKEVKRIVINRNNIGVFDFKFDGSKYSSGVYYYTLYVENNRIETKKMVLLK